MRVAITGASGFLGRALIHALKERDDSVVAFSRHPANVAVSIPGVDAVAWPPSGAFPDVDAVVHLAGESVAGRWTREKKAAIRDSRVDGTRTLVDAMLAADNPPAILISASATGYYGDRGEEALTESAAPAGDFLAKVCEQWEEEASRAQEAGIRTAMVRTSVVLSREGGALQQMLPPYRLGLGGPMGSGRQWFPWIHLDDIIALYLFLLDHDVSGPVNGVAPDPVRQGGFAKALGAAVHRPAFLPTPRVVLRVLYGEFADRLFDSQRVLPEKAERAGFTFRHPGIREALVAIFA